MRVLLLLPFLLLSAIANGSEPFTIDTAQLCIAPVGSNAIGQPDVTISFNGKARIPLAPNERTVVHLSRSQIYSVVVRNGDSRLHSFRLGFADYPSGNACLWRSRSTNKWRVTPQPPGRSGCTCQDVANGT